MVKPIFFLLLTAYLGYTVWVYVKADPGGQPPSGAATAGMRTWQQQNCQSCHQVYGLGGYMGPDLTNIISNPAKGKNYAFAFIKGGSPRMPNLHLSDSTIRELVAFLSWIDESGRTSVPAEMVTWSGNYELNKP